MKLTPVLLYPSFITLMRFGIAVKDHHRRNFPTTSPMPNASFRVFVTIDQIFPKIGNVRVHYSPDPTLITMKFPRNFRIKGIRDVLRKGRRIPKND